ncbi:hypothetical protein K7432_017828, partial [Basidiobolus ranarum]
MRLLASLFSLSILTNIAALPHYGSNGNGSSKYCNGLIVRLNALGANLNVGICTGKPENLNYNSKAIERMDCNGLVLAVEALGIKVKAGLCSKGGNGSGGTHNGGYKTGGG